MVKLLNLNTGFFPKSKFTYIYICKHTHMHLNNSFPVHAMNLFSFRLQEETWPLQLLRLANALAFLVIFCSSSPQPFHLHCADSFLPLLLNRNFYRHDALCLHALYHDSLCFQGSMFLSSYGFL